MEESDRKSRRGKNIRKRRRRGKRRKKIKKSKKRRRMRSRENGPKVPGLYHALLLGETFYLSVFISGSGPLDLPFFPVLIDCFSQIVNV